MNSTKDSGIPITISSSKPLTYLYRDSCSICLAIVFIIFIILGFGALVLTFITSSLTFLITFIILELMGIIYLSCFPLCTKISIDKTENLLVIHNLKIFSCCCQCCDSSISFDINQVYQAEIQVHYKDDTTMYKTVIRMKDGTIIPTDNTSSNIISTHEKKKNIINQMLINYRGAIEMTEAVKNDKKEMIGYI